MCSNYEIIIVGAGVAGLSAARVLLDHGIRNFLIVEAKSRPGGRIMTNEWEHGSRIELGAQWIHGEENDFFKLVRDTNHVHNQTSWEGKGTFLLPNGKVANPAIVQEVLSWVEEMIEDVENTLSHKPSKSQNRFTAFLQKFQISMGEYLRYCFLKKLEDFGITENCEDYYTRDAIFQWAMSFQRIDNSCNQMTDLSLSRWSEFQVNGGELYSNFRSGASQFINEVLVASLPKSSLSLNSPVQEIHWNDYELTSPIRVKLKDGRIFTCNHILVTCSIGFLKKNISNLFKPILPSSTEQAILATGFGPIGKIFLKWDRQWWPNDLQGYQLLWPREYINCCDDKGWEQNSSPKEMDTSWVKSITGFDPVVTSKATLLAWLGGPEAVHVEKISHEEIGKRCAETLSNFTGIDVPEPAFVEVSKWNTDEYIRGAYCYRSTETDKIPGDITTILSEPVYSVNKDINDKPLIVFAGEAMSKSHYSTLHGAFESGKSQIMKIISYLEKSSKKN